jgi:hypothetical protein
MWDQTSARAVCARQARTRHQMEPSLVKLVQQPPMQPPSERQLVVSAKQAHMEGARERQHALHVHLEHMEAARQRQLALHAVETRTRKEAL